MNKLIEIPNFENEKRYREREAEIERRKNYISPGYKSDIRQYKKYCDETSQDENLESMLDFLYISVTEQKVKKTTWEKRLTALRRYMTVQYEIDFKEYPDMADDISYIRSMYNDEENKRLIKVEGKQSVNRDDLMDMIYKLDIREKAICMVNLITANRPNEMVRLKISDFNLENNSVSIYMKKQKDWHEKRLTQEAVMFIKEYIKEYDLSDDNYFVGRVYKNGRYESTQISEEAYRKFLNRTIGLTAYNLRKTQVSSMHEKGADLSAIAKQTGHQSVKTISDHYLNVSDSTIDKYL